MSLIASVILGLATGSERSVQVLAALEQSEHTTTLAAHDSPASIQAQADYICDGADDQVDIQAAIDALPAGGGKIVLSEGTFNLSKGFDIDIDNVTLAGSGDGTKLFFTNAPKSALASNANSGQKNVVLTDATGFQVNHAVLLYSTASYGYYTIASIVGNTLTMTTNLLANYTTAESAAAIVTSYPIFTIDGANIEVSDFSIDGNRVNRVGGVNNILNGASDGSAVYPADAGYTDGSITIGQNANSTNIRVHDLTISNSSEHSIAVRALAGITHDNINIYNNTILNAGDKGILFRAVDGGTIEFGQVSNNYIDGTGLANWNDRSAGKFSWGDGIQLHYLAPRRVVITDNTVNDTARSGIWVMWSDDNGGEVLIAKNRVTNWGQKIFGNEELIHVSGIHINRGMVSITDNLLDGGFTSESPRLNESFGIYLSAGTPSGGKSREDILISRNIINGFYNSSHDTAGIYLGLGKNAVVSNNVVSGGRVTGIMLSQVSDVSVTGNVFAGLNLVFTDSTISNVRVESNVFKEVDMGHGDYSNIEILPDHSTENASETPIASSEKEIHYGVVLVIFVAVGVVLAIGILIGRRLAG